MAATKNPYQLDDADLAWFNSATRPMRRLEDGRMGEDISLKEATEAMRLAGADDRNDDPIPSSRLFDALGEVIGRRSGRN